MKTKKKRSQKQEKSVAKQFGGKQVIASGALWFAHSDVRNDQFLIECKTTIKDSYSVTSKVWEKIEEEATKDRMRTPLLVVDLKDSERLVIYDPRYFSTDVVGKYLGMGVSVPRKVQKSFSVSMKFFEEAYESFLDYAYYIQFTICGKKKNVLHCMRVKDFEEILLKEES